MVSMSTQRSKGLPSRAPLPKSNAILLILSVVAVVVSGWAVTVLAMRWPRDWAAPAFAIVVVLAPSTLLLSAWEMFRYRVTWRGVLAALLSAMATASWVYMVLEVIHRARG